MSSVTENEEGEDDGTVDKEDAPGGEMQG